jgi:phage terminase large subunit-like protein
VNQDYRDFSLDKWLATLDLRQMATREGRRIRTRLDPMAFGYTYLRHHLAGPETKEQITFSEFHLDVYRQARAWAKPNSEPAANRDVYVAPRGAAKSTMFFLMLPLWMAAHGHEDFIAAFADSGTQAEMHLATFKRELETNELLRMDFPELCAPARRARGTTEADNRGMLIASSGFVFGARGIDASSLGMKVGRRRPGLLLGDDLEPGEETYSAYQAEKRLGALVDSVLPLNVYARVVVVGTVTMPGSIVHQLVKTVTAPDEPPAQWIVDEKFRTHYYPAILTDPETGEERSLWPAKWPMSYLESIRHTRQYKKNYANDPAGRDGDYWNAEDFVYGEVPALTHQLLSIDPAVTAKKKSDFTALAVIGFSASEQRCVVRWARAVRIQPGAPLRDLVLRALELFPDIRGVLIETNQGGDVWQSVLHGLPVPVKTVHQSEPKEVRAARLLNFYQRRRNGLPLVVHEQRLPAVEEQMIGFPKGAHDDLVDCVGTGVDVFLKRAKRSGGSSVEPRYGHEDDDDAF